MRWDPFRELEEMNHCLNRLFQRSALSPTNAQASQEALTAPDWAPSCDIFETVEDYQVKAELPGVRKDDVKVTCADGMLRIEGERKQEKEEKGRKLHRVERFHGSFMRSFVMPPNVDDAKITAEFKDGLLLVRLPKTEKAAPKAVEIKAH
jgi:HSP20 family protein